jgi:hypothetical protein
MMTPETLDPEFDILDGTALIAFVAGLLCKGTGGQVRDQSDTLMAWGAAVHRANRAILAPPTCPRTIGLRYTALGRLVVDNCD